MAKMYYLKDEETIKRTKKTLKTLSEIGISFGMGALAGPIIASYAGIAKIAALISVPVASVGLGHQLSKQTDEAWEEIVDESVNKVPKKISNFKDVADAVRGAIEKD